MLNAMRVQVPVVVSSYLIRTQSPAANFIVEAALVRVRTYGVSAAFVSAAALLAMVAKVPVPAADLPTAIRRVFVAVAIAASLQICTPTT